MIFRVQTKTSKPTTIGKQEGKAIRRCGIQNDVQKSLPLNPVLWFFVLAFKAPGPPAGRRGAVAGGVRGVGPRWRRPRYGGYRPGGRPQRSTLETPKRSTRKGDFISLTLSIVHSNSQAHTWCTKTCGFLRHPTTSVPVLKLSGQHCFRSFCAHFWGPRRAQVMHAMRHLFCGIIS